jgi:hypothetical protein
MVKSECVVSDYLVAAVLKAKGVRFLGARAGSGRRCELAFDSANGEAFSILDAHRNGGVSVNSSDVVGAIHEIKDAIFAVRDGR